MRRTVPTWMLVAAGAFLALNIALAVLDGSRTAWLAVAVLALAIAATLWRRWHTPPQ